MYYSIVYSTLSSSKIFTQTRDSLENLQRIKKRLLGIKSEELFLPKRNRVRVHIKNATVSLRMLKNAVLFYGSRTNVMSLAKMLFTRHLNDMPVFGSLMSGSCTELIKIKNARLGVAHSLCNYVENTVFQRAYTKCR